MASAVFRVLCLAALLLCGALAIADAPKRVLSIGGSLTEIIYELDAQDRLVGSDTTSYYPAEAAALPKVGYMRALATEGILSLSPDLIILTDEAGPPPVIAQLQSTGVDILKLPAARTLDDIYEQVDAIARALHLPRRAARRLRARMDDDLREVNEYARGMEPVRAMFILNHRGGAPMVAGTDTAADSLIKLSGAVNVVDGYEGYKPLTPEAAVQMKPDVILITRRGLERAGGKEALLDVPGVALTPAGQQGRVIAMDALLMLGFGPRTPAAALELSKAYRKQ